MRALTAIASLTSIALLFIGPSAASASTEEPMSVTVSVIDTTGVGVAGAEVRVFIDDARRWENVGATNADGSVVFATTSDVLTFAQASVEVTWKGARLVLPLRQQDVSLVTARIEVGNADVVALDTGSGWTAHTDSTEVLPGRTAIRLTDGSVIKADLTAGHIFDVETGVQTPVAAPAPSSTTSTPPTTAVESSTTTTAPPTSAEISTTTEPEPTTTTAPAPSTTDAESSTSTTSSTVETTTTVEATTTTVQSTTSSTTSTVQSGGEGS